MCYTGKIMKLGCVLLTGALISLGGVEMAKAFSVEQRADIWPGGGDSWPGGFAVFGSDLIFGANDGIAGYEL